MATFKEIIMKVPLTPAEIDDFDFLSRSWETFCLEVSTMNKLELVKLLKYLVQNRPHSKTYLVRAVAKFNALNRLKVEDLL